MATAPVGFLVPQMQEGLDKREALDCVILDCIDYCTVLWDGSSGKTDVNMTIIARMGKNNGENKTFALRATLPSKMKRLINPNNKTLGLPK